MISIFLSGDSMITRRLPFSRPEAASLADLIREVDVAFTNLEVVPSGFAGHPIPSDGGMHLCTDPQVVDDLLDAGFNLFAAANNHSLDLGVEGLLAGMDNLTSRGVAFSGMGANLAMARRPTVLDTPAGSISLVACTAAFRPGQQAGRARKDFQGRPGVSPLTPHAVFELDAASFALVTDLADKLGFTAEQAQLAALGVPDRSVAGEVTAFNVRFRPGETVGVTHEYDSTDIEEILASVRDAAQRSDLVILSVHSHENGSSADAPPEHLRQFCHQAVAAGASIVAVHGAHSLRGAEIVDGAAVFYGLGNFIAQNELVDKLPADSYEFFGVDLDSTPSDVYNARTASDTKGFPTLRPCWESIVPVCTFDMGRVSEVTVHPITLGFGQSRQRRGRPSMATGEQAAGVLAQFVRLSGDLGQSFTVEPSTHGLVARLAADRPTGG